VIVPNLLIGTAYAVSAGLIIYAVQSDLAPQDVRFPLILAWAVAGLVLSFVAVWRRTEQKA
jgi:Co/Zn/Cd efflux system component